MAFTVRDMEASAVWYRRVFGWVELRRYTTVEAGTPRILLLDPNSFFVVALCQPDRSAPGCFDHRNTGLDHFAFAVTDDAELERWAFHLRDHGVLASPIREVPGLGKFTSFEDPDGIQLELWLTALDDGPEQP